VTLDTDPAIGFGKVVNADSLEQLVRSVKQLPFAQLISAARQRQGLSLNGVARGMHAAARQEGTHCGTTRQAILGYERGRIPHPDGLRWLAFAVGLPFEEVAAAARQQRRRRLELRLLASTTVVAPSAESQCGTLDEDDVERRQLLLIFGRAATAGLLASTLQPLRGLASAAPIGIDTLEAAMTISKSYRRLWATTPAEDLRDLVLGHLRLISRLLASATSETDRASLAAAASDACLVAASVAEDCWDLAGAQQHYQDAQTYAERSDDPMLQAYAAGCMSYWATMRGSGTEAVKAIQRAKRFLSPSAPPAAHASIAIREATAHAVAHDEPAMSSALLRAEKAFDEQGTSDPAGWSWGLLNGEKISRYRGFGAVSLKRPETAVPALKEGLDSLGPAPNKTRQYAMSKMAEAYVQTGDVEQACDLGAQALAMAVQLGDTLGVMAVRQVRVQLTPLQATPAVKAFDERALSSLLALSPAEGHLKSGC